MKKHDSEGVADIYNQLIEAIGFDNTKKVFEIFKGQQIAFPKRFYKQEYVIKKVMEMYDGRNINELAREFDYTDRYLRRLISSKTKELDTS